MEGSLGNFYAHDVPVDQSRYRPALVGASSVQRRTSSRDLAEGSEDAYGGQPREFLRARVCTVPVTVPCSGAASVGSVEVQASKS